MAGDSTQGTPQKDDKSAKKDDSQGQPAPSKDVHKPADGPPSGADTDTIAERLSLSVFGNGSEAAKQWRLTPRATTGAELASLSIDHPEADPNAKFISYTVKPNDTLSQISKRALGPHASRQEIYSFVGEIAKANHIKNPNLILDGQHLQIPAGRVHQIRNRGNTPGQTPDLPLSRLPAHQNPDQPPRAVPTLPYFDPIPSEQAHPGASPAAPQWVLPQAAQTEPTKPVVPTEATPPVVHTEATPPVVHTEATPPVARTDDKGGPPAAQPAQVDLAGAAADAKAIAQLTGVSNGTSPDLDGIFKIMQGKNEAQRQAIDEQYRKGNGIGLEDAVLQASKRLNSDAATLQFNRFDSLMHTKDGDQVSMNGGRLHDALFELDKGAGRSQSQISADIIGTLRMMNHDQIEAMEKLYQQRYGTSLHDAIQNDSNLSDATRTAADVYLKGNDQLKEDDFKKLASTALTAKDIDLFGAVMSGAQPDWRANFLTGGGGQAIQQSFSGADQRHALDLAKFGRLSTETGVDDSTGFVFHNQENAEVALRRMTPLEQSDYLIGKHLTDPKFEISKKNQALLDKMAPEDQDAATKYYARMHDKLETIARSDVSFNGFFRGVTSDLTFGLGSLGYSTETQMAKYEAIIGGKNDFAASLSKHEGWLYNDSSDTIVADINNMSQQNWEDAKAHPERRAEVEQMLKSLNRDSPEVMAAYDKKMAPDQWGQAQGIGHEGATKPDAPSQPPEETLHGLITGWFGSDSILDTLRNVPPQDLDKVMAAYAEKYGTSLQGDLYNKLSSSKMKEADDIMSARLTVAEQVNRVRDQAYETRSGWAAYATDYVFRSGAGFTLDDSVRDLTTQAATANQHHEDLDPKKFTESIDITKAAVTNHIAAKDYFADNAVMALQIGGGIAVTAAAMATGVGEAGLILGGATLVVGAATSPLVRMAIKGQDYDYSKNNIGFDAAIGGLTSLPFGMGTAAKFAGNFLVRSAFAECEDLGTTLATRTAAEFGERLGSQIGTRVTLQDGWQQTLGPELSLVVARAAQSNASKVEVKDIMATVIKSGVVQFDPKDAVAREAAEAAISLMSRDLAAGLNKTGAMLTARQITNVGAGATGGLYSGAFQGAVNIDPTQGFDASATRFTQTVTSSAFMGAIMGAGMSHGMYMGHRVWSDHISPYVSGDNFSYLPDTQHGLYVDSADNIITRASEVNPANVQIGRDALSLKPGQTIKFGDHAEIGLDSQGRMFIADLGGQHEPAVILRPGRPPREIQPKGGKPIRLKPGDEVRVGGVDGLPVRIVDPHAPHQDVLTARTQGELEHLTRTAGLTPGQTALTMPMRQFAQDGRALLESWTTDVSNNPTKIAERRDQLAGILQRSNPWGSRFDVAALVDEIPEADIARAYKHNLKRGVDDNVVRVLKPIGQKMFGYGPEPVGTSHPGSQDAGLRPSGEARGDTTAARNAEIAEEITKLNAAREGLVASPDSARNALTYGDTVDEALGVIFGKQWTDLLTPTDFQLLSAVRKGKITKSDAERLGLKISQRSFAHDGQPQRVATLDDETTAGIVNKILDQKIAMLRSESVVARLDAALGSDAPSTELAAKRSALAQSSTQAQAIWQPDLGLAVRDVFGPEGAKLLSVNDISLLQSMRESRGPENYPTITNQHAAEIISGIIDQKLSLLGRESLVRQFSAEQAALEGRPALAREQMQGSRDVDAWVQSTFGPAGARYFSSTDLAQLAVAHRGEVTQAQARSAGITLDPKSFSRSTQAAKVAPITDKQATAIVSQIIDSKIALLNARLRDSTSGYIGDPVQTRARAIADRIEQAIRTDNADSMFTPSAIRAAAYLSNRTATAARATREYLAPYLSKFATIERRLDSQQPGTAAPPRPVQPGDQLIFTVPHSLGAPTDHVFTAINMIDDTHMLLRDDSRILATDKPLPLLGVAQSEKPALIIQQLEQNKFQINNQTYYYDSLGFVYKKVSDSDDIAQRFVLQGNLRVRPIRLLERSNTATSEKPSATKEPTPNTATSNTAREHADQIDPANPLGTPSAKADPTGAADPVPAKADPAAANTQQQPNPDPTKATDPPSTNADPDPAASTQPADDKPAGETPPPPEPRAKLEESAGRRKASIDETDTLGKAAPEATINGNVASLLDSRIDKITVKQTGLSIERTGPAGMFGRDYNIVDSSGDTITLHNVVTSGDRLDRSNTEADRLLYLAVMGQEPISVKDLAKLAKTSRIAVAELQTKLNPPRPFEFEFNTTPHAQLDSISVVSEGASLQFYQNVRTTLQEFSPAVLNLLDQKSMKVRSARAPSDVLSTEQLAMQARGNRPGVTLAHLNFFDPQKGEVVISEYVSGPAEWASYRLRPDGGVERYSSSSRPEERGSFDHVINDNVRELIHHEVGHAVDMALGEFSAHEEFVSAYNRDIAQILTDNDRSQILAANTRTAEFLQYALQEGEAGRQEAFAELFAILNGSGITGYGRDAQNFLESFPRSAELIRNRLSPLLKEQAETHEPARPTGESEQAEPPPTRTFKEAGLEQSTPVLGEAVVADRLMDAVWPVLADKVDLYSHIANLTAARDAATANARSDIAAALGRTPQSLEFKNVLKMRKLLADHVSLLDLYEAWRQTYNETTKSLTAVEQELRVKLEADLEAMQAAVNTFTRAHGLPDVKLSFEPRATDEYDPSTATIYLSQSMTNLPRLLFNISHELTHHEQLTLIVRSHVERIGPQDNLRNTLATANVTVSDPFVKQIIAAARDGTDLSPAEQARAAILEPSITTDHSVDAAILVEFQASRKLLDEIGGPLQAPLDEALSRFDTALDSHPGSADIRGEINGIRQDVRDSGGDIEAERAAVFNLVAERTQEVISQITSDRESYREQPHELEPSWSSFVAYEAISKAVADHVPADQLESIATALERHRPSLDKLLSEFAADERFKQWRFAAELAHQSNLTSLQDQLVPAIQVLRPEEQLQALEWLDQTIAADKTGPATAIPETSGEQTRIPLTTGDPAAASTAEEAAEAIGDLFNGLKEGTTDHAEAGTAELWQKLPDDLKQDAQKLSNAILSSIDPAILDRLDASDAGVRQMIAGVADGSLIMSASDFFNEVMPAIEREMLHAEPATPPPATAVSNQPHNSGAIVFEQRLSALPMADRTAEWRSAFDAADAKGFTESADQLEAAIALLPPDMQAVARHDFAEALTWHTNPEKLPPAKPEATVLGFGRLTLERGQTLTMPLRPGDHAPVMFGWDEAGLFASQARPDAGQDRSVEPAKVYMAERRDSNGDIRYAAVLNGQRVAIRPEQIGPPRPPHWQSSDGPGGLRIWQQGNNRFVEIGGQDHFLRSQDGKWFYYPQQAQHQEGLVKVHVAASNSADFARLLPVVLPALLHDPVVGHLNQGWKVFDPLNAAHNAFFMDADGDRTVTIYARTKKEALEIAQRLDKLCAEAKIPLDSTHRQDISGTRVGETGRALLVRDYWKGARADSTQGVLLDAPLAEKILADRRPDESADGFLRRVELDVGLFPKFLRFSDDGQLMLRVPEPAESPTNPGYLYLGDRNGNAEVGSLTGRPAMYALHERFGIDPIASAEDPPAGKSDNPADRPSEQAQLEGQGTTRASHQDPAVSTGDLAPGQRTSDQAQSHLQHAEPPVEAPEPSIFNLGDDLFVPQADGWALNFKKLPPGSKVEPIGETSDDVATTADKRAEDTPVGARVRFGEHGPEFELRNNEWTDTNTGTKFPRNAVTFSEDGVVRAALESPLLISEVPTATRVEYGPNGKIQSVKVGNRTFQRDEQGHLINERNGEVMHGEPTLRLSDSGWQGVIQTDQGWRYFEDSKILTPDDIVIHHDDTRETPNGMLLDKDNRVMSGNAPTEIADASMVTAWDEAAYRAELGFGDLPPGTFVIDIGGGLINRDFGPGVVTINLNHKYMGAKGVPGREVVGVAQDMPFPDESADLMVARLSVPLWMRGKEQIQQMTTNAVSKLAPGAQLRIVPIPDIPLIFMKEVLDKSDVTYRIEPAANNKPPRLVIERNATPEQLADRQVRQSANARIFQTEFAKRRDVEMGLVQIWRAARTNLTGEPFERFSNDLAKAFESRATQTTNGRMQAINDVLKQHGLDDYLLGARDGAIAWVPSDKLTDTVIAGNAARLLSDGTVGELNISATGWRIERTDLEGSPGYGIFDDQGRLVTTTSGPTTISLNKSTGQLEFSDGWRRSADPTILDAVAGGLKPTVTMLPNDHVRLAFDQLPNAPHVVFNHEGTIVEARLGTSLFKQDEDGHLVSTESRVQIGRNRMLKFDDGVPTLAWRNGSEPDILSINNNGDPLQRRVGTVVFHVGDRGPALLDLGSIKYEFDNTAGAWVKIDGAERTTQPAGLDLKRSNWHSDANVFFLDSAARTMPASMWHGPDGRPNKVLIGDRAFVRPNDTHPLVQIEPLSDAGTIMVGEPSLKFTEGSNARPIIVTDKNVTYAEDGSTVDAHGNQVLADRTGPIPADIGESRTNALRDDIDNAAGAGDTDKLRQIYLDEWLPHSESELLSGQRRDSGTLEMRELSDRYGAMISFMQENKFAEDAEALLDRWQGLTGAKHELDHRTESVMVGENAAEVRRGGELASLQILSSGWSIARTSVEGEPRYNIFDEQGKLWMTTDGPATMYVNGYTGELEYTDGWRRSADPLILQSIAGGLKPMVTTTADGGTRVQFDELPDSPYVVYNTRGTIVEAKLAGKQFLPDKNGRLRSSPQELPFDYNTIFSVIEGIPTMTTLFARSSETESLNNNGTVVKTLGVNRVTTTADGALEVELGGHRYKAAPKEKTMSELAGGQWAPTPLNARVTRSNHSPEWYISVRHTSMEDTNYGQIFYGADGQVSRAVIGERQFTRTLDDPHLIQTKPKLGQGSVMVGEPSLKYENGEPILVTTADVTYTVGGKTLARSGSEVTNPEVHPVPPSGATHDHLHAMTEAIEAALKAADVQATAALFTSGDWLPYADATLAAGRSLDGGSLEMRELSDRYTEVISYLQEHSAEHDFADRIANVMDRWYKLTGTRHALDTRGEPAPRDGGGAPEHPPDARLLQAVLDGHKVIFDKSGNFEILADVKLAASGAVRPRADIPDEKAPAVSSLIVPSTGWRIERTLVEGEPGYRVLDENGNEWWRTTGGANIFANRNSGKLEFSDGWRRSPDTAMLEAFVNGYQPELSKLPGDRTKLTLGKGENASYVIFDGRGAIVEAKIGNEEIQVNFQGRFMSRSGFPIGDNAILHFADGEPVLSWRHDSEPDIYTLHGNGRYERRIGDISLSRESFDRLFPEVEMGPYQYRFDRATQRWREFDGEKWTELPEGSIVERAHWHPHGVVFVGGESHGIIWRDANARTAQIAVGERTWVRAADGNTFIQTRPDAERGLVMQGEPQLRYAPGVQPVIVTDEDIYYLADGSTVDGEGRPVPSTRIDDVPSELQASYDNAFEMALSAARSQGDIDQMIDLYNQYLGQSEAGLANGRRKDASSFEMRELSNRFARAIELMQQNKRSSEATRTMDRWFELTGSRHELDRRASGISGMVRRFFVSEAPRAGSAAEAAGVQSLDTPMMAGRGNFWRFARDTEIQRSMQTGNRDFVVASGDAKELIARLRSDENAGGHLIVQEVLADRTLGPQRKLWVQHMNRGGAVAKEAEHADLVATCEPDAITDPAVRSKHVLDGAGDVFLQRLEQGRDGMDIIRISDDDHAGNGRGNDVARLRSADGFAELPESAGEYSKDGWITSLVSDVKELFVRSGSPRRSFASDGSLQTLQVRENSTPSSIAFNPLMSVHEAVVGKLHFVGSDASVEERNTGIKLARPAQISRRLMGGVVLDFPRSYARAEYNRSGEMTAAQVGRHRLERNRNGQIDLLEFGLDGRRRLIRTINGDMTLTAARNGVPEITVRSPGHPEALVLSHESGDDHIDVLVNGVRLRRGIHEWVAADTGTENYRFDSRINRWIELNQGREMPQGFRVVHESGSADVRLMVEDLDPAASAKHQSDVTAALKFYERLRKERSEPGDRRDAITVREANALLTMSREVTKHESDAGRVTGAQLDEMAEMLRSRGDVSAAAVEYIVKHAQDLKLDAASFGSIINDVKRALQYKQIVLSWKLNPDLAKSFEPQIERAWIRHTGHEAASEDSINLAEAKMAILLSRYLPETVADMRNALRLARGVKAEFLLRRALEEAEKDKFDWNQAKLTRNFERAAGYERAINISTKDDPLRARYPGHYHITDDELWALMVLRDTNPQLARAYAKRLGENGPAARWITDAALQEDPAHRPQYLRQNLLDYDVHPGLFLGSSAVHDVGAVYGLIEAWRAGDRESVRAQRAKFELSYEDGRVLTHLRTNGPPEALKAWQEILRLHGTAGEFLAGWEENYLDNFYSERFSARLSQHAKSFDEDKAYLETMEQLASQGLPPLPFDVDAVGKMYMLSVLDPERAARLAQLFARRGYEDYFKANMFVHHPSSMLSSLGDRYLKKEAPRFAEAMRTLEPVQEKGGVDSVPFGQPVDGLSIKEVEALGVLYRQPLDKDFVEDVAARLSQRGINARWLVDMLKGYEPHAASGKPLTAADIRVMENARLFIKADVNLKAQQRWRLRDEPGNRLEGWAFKETRDAVLAAVEVSRKLGAVTREHAQAVASIKQLLDAEATSGTIREKPDVIRHMGADPRIAALADSAIIGIYDRLAQATGASTKLRLQSMTAEQLAAAGEAWHIDPGLPEQLAIETGLLSEFDKIATAVAWARSGAKADSRGNLGHSARQLFESEYERARQLDKRELVTSLVNPAALKQAIEVALPGVDAKLPLLRALKQTPEPYKVIKILMALPPGEYDLALAKFGGGAMASDSFAPIGALRLVATFGKKWPEWLSSRSAETIHDATFWLPGHVKMSEELRAKLHDHDGNSLNEKDVEDWQEHSRVSLATFLTRYSDKPLTDLQMASRRWGELETQLQQKSFDEIIKHLRLTTYSKAKNQKFALGAGEHGVSAERYYSYEPRLIASLKVPPAFDTTVVFGAKGKVAPDQLAKFKGLTGRWVPRDEVETIYFGHKVNCCQMEGGLASAAAWHSQESKVGGLFVVENEKGEWIAGSWVYHHGKDKPVVFDNCEALTLGTRNAEVLDIYKQAAKELLKDHSIVLIGTAHSDLDIAGLTDAGGKSAPLPADYLALGHVYTDAAKQKILDERGREEPPSQHVDTNEAAPTVAEPAPQVVSEPAALKVRGVRQGDLAAMAEIARQHYPEEWRDLQAEAQTEGLVLEDGQGNIQGYTAFEPGDEDADWYISDIAVRRGSGARGSIKLMHELLAIMKQRGGIWSADARESTSKKLLDYAASRGLIEILSQERGETMNGEAMTYMRFEAKEQAAAAEQEQANAEAEGARRTVSRSEFFEAARNTEIVRAPRENAREYQVVQGNIKRIIDQLKKDEHSDGAFMVHVQEVNEQGKPGRTQKMLILHGSKQLPDQAASADVIAMCDPQSTDDPDQLLANRVAFGSGKVILQLLKPQFKGQRATFRLVREGADLSGDPRIVQSEIPLA